MQQRTAPGGRLRASLRGSVTALLLCLAAAQCSRSPTDPSPGGSPPTVPNTPSVPGPIPSVSEVFSGAGDIAFCHNPQTCVILSADDGKIFATLPIGSGTDGGGFNPNTMEAFSSQRDGTLTIIKENSPTSFEVEQTVQTRQGAKTCTLDTKNNQIVLITTEPPPSASAVGTPPAGADQPGGGQRGGRGSGPALLDILVVSR